MRTHKHRDIPATGNGTRSDGSRALCLSDIRIARPTSRRREAREAMLALSAALSMDVAYPGTLLPGDPGSDSGESLPPCSTLRVGAAAQLRMRLSNCGRAGVRRCAAAGIGAAG